MGLLELSIGNGVLEGRDRSIRLAQALAVGLALVELGGSGCPRRCVSLSEGLLLAFPSSTNRLASRHEPPANPFVSTVTRPSLSTVISMVFTRHPRP